MCTSFSSICSHSYSMWSKFGLCGYLGIYRNFSFPDLQSALECAWVFWSGQVHGETKDINSDSITRTLSLWKYETGKGTCLWSMQLRIQILEKYAFKYFNMPDTLDSLISLQGPMDYSYPTQKESSLGNLDWVSPHILKIFLKTKYIFKHWFLKAKLHQVFSECSEMV